MGGVALAIFRQGAGEVVEDAAEQVVARLAVVPAVGIVDEAEPSVRCDTGDELVLRVHHRTVARLAGAHGRLGLLLLGDVAPDGDMVGDPAMAVAQRRDRRVLGDELAVLAAVDDPALPAGTLADAALDGVVERIRAAAGQHLARPPADHLLGRVARQPLEGAVDVGVAALGVGDLDRVADLVDGHGHERELLLAPPPLGDVAGEQDAPAVRHPALAHPAPAAVGELVLMLVLVVDPQGEAPVDEVLPHVGVIDRAEGGARADPVLEPLPEPEHLAQVRRQVRRVAAVVEDEAIVGIQDGEAVGDALGRSQEPRLGLAAVGDVGGQQHPAAVRHGRLADADPAAVDMLVLALGQASGTGGQALLAIVRPHVGMIDRPARQALAHPVGEADPRAQDLAQGRRQHLRVAAVVEDDPVLGIEDDQAVGDALGRRQEARLAGAQCCLGPDLLRHVPLGRDEVHQPTRLVHDR